VEKYDVIAGADDYDATVSKKEVPDIANSIKSARQEYYKKY